MADIKWVKLSTSFPDNRKIKKIRRLPDGNNVVLLWVFLISKAGESNEQGGLFFLEDMPYTIEDLAEEFDFTYDFVRFGLATLERMQMVETYDDIIYIKNWEKYQSSDKMEKIREQTRKRVAEHRKNKSLPNAKSNVTQPLHVTQSNAREQELELDKELDNIYHLFSFWNEQKIIEHRKMNKAMQSHINARLQEYSTDELKQAITNYADILKSDDYYWTHKWTLQDFMKPDNVVRFTDEAEPKKNFKSSKNESKKGKAVNLDDFDLND